MEELLEKFSSGLKTDTEETQRYRMSQFRSHEFSALDQEIRRNMILTRQKSLFQSDIDARRGILDVLEEVEHSEQETKKKIYTPSLYIPGFHERQKDLTNLLMLSEWLNEVPKDMCEKWVVLACPKGIRVLLVATKGQTKIYNKFGKLHKVWQSNLPGGNSNIGEFKKSCVLDCIWSEATKSVYVLDVLMWVNQTVTNCDMDFRDNWLKSKFSECSNITEISEQNQFPIYLVPKYGCDKSTFQKFLIHWPPYYEDNPNVDGFLFYHREAHYISGITPLAGWLYPFMVNEVFGSDVTVHDSYLKMKPDNYINKDAFIKMFEEKQAFKKLHIEKRLNKKMFESTELQIKLENNLDVDDTKVFPFSGNDKDLKLKKKKNSKSNRKMDVEIGSSECTSDFVDGCSLSNNNMEFDANVSTDVDSAISSMEDSIIEDGVKVDEQISESLPIVC